MESKNVLSFARDIFVAFSGTQFSYGFILSYSLIENFSGLKTLPAGISDSISDLFPVSFPASQWGKAGMTRLIH
jgi:hypothetical protein